ncbi:hypothetical protein ECEC1845_1311, partial [Escherichia coli EC1845]
MLQCKCKDVFCS